MTFIEMLQQGGYILPQYSQGQQFYAAPNSGMQTLNTMMQVDQQAQNRYIQGEQLNLQRAQTTQNIINSTIQNELNRKTQERLQKQMDLSNKKLEFQMQKEILDRMEEQRKYVKDNFLLKDQLKIQEALEKAGFGEADLIGKMGGGMDMENFMKWEVGGRAIIGTHKQAFTDMNTFGQGKDYLAQAEKQLELVDDLYKDGVLNYEVHNKFIDDLREATKQLIDFQNGAIPALDFKSEAWAGILGVQDFIDETLMEQKRIADQKLQEAKTTKLGVDSEVALMEAEMQKELLPVKKDLLVAQAALDKAEAESTLALIPVQQQESAIKMVSTFAKHVPTLAILSKYGLNYDPAKPSSFFDALKNMPPGELQALNAELSQNIQAAGDAKTPQNGEQLMVWGYLNNNPEAIEMGRAILAEVNQAKHSTVTHKTDYNGHQYIQDGSNRVYDTQGRIANSKGETVQLNNPLKSSGITSNFILETSGNKKGKFKISKDGKDYYVDHRENNGVYELVFTLSDLEGLLGYADNKWYGINELKDYLDTEAGNAFLDSSIARIEDGKMIVTVPPFNSTNMNSNPSTNGVPNYAK